MRKLKGFVEIAACELDFLKSKALLFDKFVVAISREEGKSHEEEAELSFLREQGLVEFPGRDLFPMQDGEIVLSDEESYLLQKLYPSKITPLTRGGNKVSVRLHPMTSRAIMERFMAARIACLEADTDYDNVPIWRHWPPEASPGSRSTDVMRVACEYFPIPAADSPWEDIFDFRQEMSEKRWNFRRFLTTLASKKQTEAEIRDDLEWTLNEYREGMKKRRMKIVRSSVAALVVPAVDLIFNASGNHAAALVAAGIAINRLRVELLEAEMKAPGRECAYVFEAQKRFGKSL
jgi:hypothetical protein